LEIITGAALPEGLDTVLMQEDIEIDGDCVRSRRRLRSGLNVRHAGEDLKAGEVVLAAGRLLTSPDIGLLASLGISEVEVKRRLTVAIASTGDELCLPGKGLTDAGLFDSNRYRLFAALKRREVELIDLYKSSLNIFTKLARLSAQLLFLQRFSSSAYQLLEPLRQ